MLKTLIGEQKNFTSTSEGEVIYITYPPNYPDLLHKILRIEDEDCVVVEDSKCEEFLSIDHIISITIRKK
jgi:hypothetical protein